MKKSIAFILAMIILVSSCVCSTVIAATACTVSVSSVSGSRGDTVNVSVYISSNSNMQACGFTLSYDKNVLELVSCKKGSIVSASPIINTNQLGKVVYSYASTSPLTSAGSLLDVTFTINSDAAYGASDISVAVTEMSDGSFEAITCTVNNGAVDVIAPALDAPSYIETTLVEDTYAAVMWQEVEGATGYNVYLNGELFTAEPLADNFCSFNELLQNSEYTVEVTTVNYNTESDKSAALKINTLVSVYTVTFVDWSYNTEYEDENSIINVTHVAHGSAATAPEDPTREGYVFAGWDLDYTNVTEHIVVQAQYDPITPTVTFVDWDGTVLSTQTVEYGKSATAPDYPSRDGYVFTTWDKNFDAVTEDITVTAQYAEITCEHTNTELQGAVESTCVTAGNGGSLVCKDCGTVLSVGTELELAAHKYNSVITEPAPNAQGFTTHTCSVCGDSYVDSYTEYVDENAPKIIVSSARGTLGRQVNITVSLANNPGIVSATLRVVYDSSVMTLSAVEDTDLLSGSMHSDQFTSPYVLTWANDTVKNNITVNGTLVTLTFDIAEDAEVGSYPVKVVYDYDNYDIMNYDSDKVKFYTVDGVVDVSDVIIGDVNGDGNVNNLDRLVLARYLANWADYPAEMIDMTAADVNCDGNVNNRDRLILARYLAHWADYPEIPLI